MDSLNLNKLNSQQSKNIKIGELSQEVINTLHLDLNPQNILIWSNRIQEHCEKHKDEYSTPSAYNQAIKSIPQIIYNPDYVRITSKWKYSICKKT